VVLLQVTYGFARRRRNPATDLTGSGSGIVDLRNYRQTYLCLRIRVEPVELNRDAAAAAHWRHPLVLVGARMSRVSGSSRSRSIQSPRRDRKRKTSSRAVSLSKAISSLEMYGKPISRVTLAGRCGGGLK